MIRAAVRAFTNSIGCLLEVALDEIRQHGATAEARRHHTIWRRRP